MQVSQARDYIGRNCSVTWTDFTGREQTTVFKVHDLQFVPLYGAYLVGEFEELSLDKVTSIRTVD